MPAALSIGERRQIVSMREQGQTFGAIAEDLGRDYETVRKFYHRYMQSGQLEVNYDKYWHQEIRGDKAVYQRAVQLKPTHPNRVLV